MSAEAAKILEQLGACPSKVEEYREKDGDLRTLWDTATEPDKGVVAAMLFTDKRHDDVCSYCGGKLPSWIEIHEQLIRRGLIADDRCLIFAPVYSKSEPRNG